MALYAAEGQVIPLDGHPLDRAVELLAARHGITTEEARWRLDRIAAFVRVSDRLLAELILLGESQADG